MNRILYLYAHNKNSRAAKALSRHLLVKRIRHLDSSFIGNFHKTVINWGASAVPFEATKCMLLNPPEKVNEVIDKLNFFKVLEGKKITPRFTTDIKIAKRWIKNNKKIVVCRTIINSSSGRGIVLSNKINTLVDAPLYVRYVPKKDEYRIHIFDNRIIDIQKKAMKYGEKDANFKIRNRASGFVYKREDIEPPLEVEEVALQAFKAFSLHFGAVDVIWTENTKKALVLEINTAPGLEGQTVVSYAEAIKEYL